MKPKRIFSFVVLIILFFCVSSQSSTYLKFWINGVVSDTLTQGDSFAWELDVAAPGNMADVELFLDLDASHSITESDRLMTILHQQDGDMESDSSWVPDGIIYFDLGLFGFAPTTYFLRVTDRDKSSVTGWFTILPRDNPPATISGTIFIEGISAPDPLYENILIGAFGMALTSGLTDINGKYSINLPEAGETWGVGPILSSLSRLITPNSLDIVAPAGDTPDIDFTFVQAQAWVYGSLLDQDGLPPDRIGIIELENETNGTRSSARLVDGKFNLPAAFESGQMTNQVHVTFESEMLQPDYLTPYNRGEEFSLSIGDSIEKNMIAYATNANIYGYITEDGTLPSQGYKLFGQAENIGDTRAISHPETGYFEMPVRSGYEYWIFLETDPESALPPRPGYVVDGGTTKFAEVGDTLYYNFIQAVDLLSGSLLFDRGDPIIFDFDHHHIWVMDTLDNNLYNTRAEEDFTYAIPVPGGTYHVHFQPEVNKYLVKPAQYQYVTVAHDTIDTLDFELNYAHASLTVKLINAPIPEWFDGYDIQTLGEWPDVYSTWKPFNWSDSTFVFDICEGSWYLHVPFHNQDYSVLRGDTVLTVSESDSSYYVEFEYINLTKLPSASNLPYTYELKHNYPNPFNPSTVISWQLAVGSHVELTIYNILGENVATLLSERQKAGYHSFEWNASGFASGVYYYKLEAGEFQQVKKMVLLR